MSLEDILVNAGIINPQKQPIIINTPPIQKQNQFNGYTYFYTIIKKINSSNGTQQNAPDYQFKNPRGRDTRLLSLMLITDVNMAINGSSIIQLNGGHILDFGTGDFSDMRVFSLPIPDSGLNFPAQSSLDFFIWNSTDSTPINLTVIPTIGDF